MIKVAVIRGGPSAEHEISLRSGKSVIDNLSSNIYKPLDIYIDKKGVWHVGGIPKTPINALKNVDVAFNALHGNYGEDGKVQQILNTIGIPYTGSGSVASALAMNKVITKDILKNNGIKTPYHRVVTVDDITNDGILEIYRTFPHPAIVKPINSGSSIGVSLVKKFDDLKPALSSAFEHSAKVLLEEYIAGREGSLAVIDNFRDQEHYALIPVELLKEKETIHEMSCKLDGNANVICPSRFSRDEVEEITRSVIEAHKALYMNHYSRTDFIVHPKRGVYILEVNSLPELTDSGIFSKSLHEVGVKLSDMLHHVIQLALGRG